MPLLFSPVLQLVAGDSFLSANSTQASPSTVPVGSALEVTAFLPRAVVLVQKQSSLGHGAQGCGLGRLLPTGCRGQAFSLKNLNPGEM